MLKGHARILGPTGVAPEKLDEGMAILIPAGMPHAIENMGRTSSAVLLDVFAPMGPGARLPRSEGRGGAGGVRGDPRRAPPAAPGGREVHRRRAAAETLPVFGGKGKIKPLLEPAKTGNKRALRRHPGGGAGRRGAAQQPPGVGGDPVRAVGRRRRSPSAARRSPSGRGGAAHPRRTAARRQVHRPGQDVMLQVFAPAGPEERYRAAQPAAAASQDQDQVKRPMIDFELSEEQRVLQAAVREMCERLIIPNARRWDEEERFPHEIVPAHGRDGPARDADPGGVRRRGDEVPRLRHRAGGGRARRRVDRADDGVAQLALHRAHLPGRQRGAEAEVPAAAGERQGAGRLGPDRARLRLGRRRGAHARRAQGRPAGSSPAPRPSSPRARSARSTSSSRRPARRRRPRG